MPDTKQTDAAVILSAQQTESLRCLVGLMIPADEAFAVPSAADERIFADILKSMGRNAAYFMELAKKLDELCGGAFETLGNKAQEAVFARLQAEVATAFKFTARTVLQCYYRDDRVMRSLEMEVRPPFPRGFEVERGDWSLLEPVRSRAPFYRKVS